MTIQVSEALDTDTAEIITVIRTESGSYVDGIYQKGSQTTFKALASVQPSSPEEIQFLPEGERQKQIRSFYCNKAVRTTDDRKAVIADVILYKGDSFKIVQLGDWSPYGYTLAYGAKE